MPDQRQSIILMQAGAQECVERRQLICLRSKLPRCAAQSKTNKTQRAWGKEGTEGQHSTHLVGHCIVGDIAIRDRACWTGVRRVEVGDQTTSETTQPIWDAAAWRASGKCQATMQRRCWGANR